MTTKKVLEKKNKLFSNYECLLYSFSLCYLAWYSYPTIEINNDFTPIYREAIKAVNPLEIVKDEDTYKDFVTF